MKEPRYLLYCFVAIIVGCPIGALWFEMGMAVKNGSDHPFASLPLTIFDSFLVGWFPALLFGALLHYFMQRLGWRNVWQWVLGGASLAWGLFSIGVWIEKVDPGFLSFLFWGVTLLKNVSNKTWPAAICGAITSAVLCWVASMVAPVATPAAAS